jgi:hypothetical protein
MIGQGVTDALYGAVQSIWDIGREIPTTISDMIDFAGDIITDTLYGAIQSIWDITKEIPSTVSEWIDFASGIILDTLLKIPEFIVNSTIQLFNWIKWRIYWLFGMVHQVLPWSFWALAPIVGSILFVGAILFIYTILYIYEKIPLVG